MIIREIWSIKLEFPNFFWGVYFDERNFHISGASVSLKIHHQIYKSYHKFNDWFWWLGWAEGQSLNWIFNSFFPKTVAILFLLSDRLPPPPPPFPCQFLDDLFPEDPPEPPLDGCPPSPTPPSVNYHPPRPESWTWDLQVEAGLWGELLISFWPDSRPARLSCECERPTLVPLPLLAIVDPLWWTRSCSLALLSASVSSYRSSHSLCTVSCKKATWKLQRQGIHWQI